jgi:hypothetical protein
MGLCAVSRWCERVQKQRQSAVKLGSRSNFRTDHAGFTNPARPEAIGGQPSKNRHLHYISIGYGGESVSQPPLKDKAFSTFLGQNPPFKPRPKMGFRSRQEPVQPMAHHRPQRHQATSERQIAGAPLGLFAVQLLGNPIAANPSSDPSPSMRIGGPPWRPSDPLGPKETPPPSR